MSFSKLENLEAISLITIIMINNIILNLPKNIISSTGSSAWINSLYIGVIAIIFTLLIIRLFKKFSGLDILDVCNYLGGKFFKTIIGIIFIVFFLSIIILVIRNFSETLKIIYFNNSPILFLILFFIIASCIANKLGIKVISKVNLILAPIILISILVVLFSTAKSFVPQRLFPILGYGINETFFAGLTNLFGFTGLAYILFLQPLLKNTKSFKKVSVVSIIISTIYLFLTVTCLLLVFSYIIDTNESISIYLLSRMTRYGEFIQRANAIFVLIWILCILSFSSITLFFSLYITQKLTNITNTNPINYCFSAIILGVTMVLQNFAEYINYIEVFFKYFTLVFIFGINLFILILANLKYKLSHKT